jgi:hypothetical protein
LPNLTFSTAVPGLVCAFQFMSPSACVEASDVVCSRDPLAVTNYILEGDGSNDGTLLRWFQTDQSQPIPFYISRGGDAVLGEQLTIDYLQEAMDAWNSVPGSNLRLVFGGIVDPEPLNSCDDGRNVITFNDPYGEAARAKGAGVTESCPDLSGRNEVVNGHKFVPYKRAGIALAPSSSFEGGVEPGSLTLFPHVLTHELGHAIGLDHSSNNPREADSNLLASVMYFAGSTMVALGAAIGPDDMNGVLQLYGHGETVPYWSCETQPFFVITGRNHADQVEILTTGVLTDVRCIGGETYGLSKPHRGVMGRKRKTVSPMNGWSFKVTRRRRTPFEVTTAIHFIDGTTRTVTTTYDPVVGDVATSSTFTVTSVTTSTTQPQCEASAPSCGGTCPDGYACLPVPPGDSTCRCSTYNVTSRR